jgi:hypothetical protein
MACHFFRAASGSRRQVFVSGYVRPLQREAKALHHMFTTAKPFINSSNQSLDNLGVDVVANEPPRGLLQLIVV